MGKPRPKELVELVLSRFTPKDPAVLLGPSLGEDAAVIDVGGGRVMVIHPDPISGAVEYLGYLSVHIPANDVAVCGARPRFLLDVIQLPGGGVDVLNLITSQIAEAAASLGMDVVGGHTEFLPGLPHPLITATAVGFARRGDVVATGGAREGDYLVMTKTAGIEGTAVLSTDFKDLLRDRGVEWEVIRRGALMVKEVSVVPEALALASKGLATSMHDPTEGGVLAGIAEIAYASRVSIDVHVDEIPVSDVTVKVCRALGLDPLKMLSSGALLATVPPGKLDESLRTLTSIGVRHSVIGRVVSGGQGLVRLVSRGYVVGEIKEPYVEDEVIALWERVSR